MGTRGPQCLGPGVLAPRPGLAGDRGLPPGQQALRQPGRPAGGRCPRGGPLAASPRRMSGTRPAQLL
eukprot:3643073-Alexandrium_andersonii.AAC.1